MGSRRFQRPQARSWPQFAGLFGALFLMSQFFQTAQGRTPLQAGAQLLVWSATGLFVAPIAGRLAGLHGNRPFMLTGSPEVFVAGFRSALWVAVAFSAVGILLALSGKRATPPEPGAAVALGGTADHRSGQEETAAGPLAMFI